MLGRDYFWKVLEGFGKFWKVPEMFQIVLSIVIGFEGEFGRFWEVLEGFGKDSSDLRYVVWS